MAKSIFDSKARKTLIKMLNEIHLSEGFTVKPCLTSTLPSCIFLGLSFQHHFLPAQQGLASQLWKNRQLNSLLKLIQICHW